MVITKKIFYCDFCHIEINTEHCKIYKENEITTCVLTVVERESTLQENGLPKRPLHMFDICIDCAMKLCKNGLRLDNYFKPPEGGNNEA